MKIANGRGATKSIFGIKLKRILPGRGGVCGCKGDGRPAFSRVRLSQNILSEFTASVDAAAIRFGKTKPFVVSTLVLVRCGVSRSATLRANCSETLSLKISSGCSDRKSVV